MSKAVKDQSSSATLEKPLWIKPSDWPDHITNFGRLEKNIDRLEQFYNDDRPRGWYQFSFREQPNGMLDFTYDAPNPENPKKHKFEKYRLYDEGTYYLPHDVALHLNGKTYPRPVIEKNAHGMNVLKRTRLVPRFSCIPTTKPLYNEDY